MAKVTSKLQVTLPKAIADRFGVRPGDDIEWRGDGATIEIVTGSTAVRTPAEQLASFDESTKEQDRRNREWRQLHDRPASGRGWTRDDLYNRARSR